MLRSAKNLDDLRQGMDILVELHQRRRAMLDEPGCFASARFLAFVHDVIPAMFRRGVLQLYWLEFDGKPIAAEYELLGDRNMYLYQCGLDPEAIKNEPGKLLHSLIVQDAIDRGCHTLDFLRGSEPYKAHFGAKPRPTLQIRVVPPRVLPRLRQRLWLARYRAKEWLKSKIRKEKPSAASARKPSDTKQPKADRNTTVAKTSPLAGPHGARERSLDTISAIGSAARSALSGPVAPKKYQQAIEHVFVNLAAQNLPDHEKAGYDEEHFAVRARELHQDVEGLRVLLKERERQGSPLKALDVGCNNGALTDLVLGADMERHGVDSVPGLIEQAAEKFPTVKFAVGSCYDLPYPDRSFDVVVTFGLLQIVSEPQRFLDELVRVTNPGGIGLIEYYPALSLPDLVARASACLARGRWADARQLIEVYRSAKIWRGVPLLKYRPSEVIASLRRCGVTRVINVSRRCFFFNSHRGVIAFVR